MHDASNLDRTAICCVGESLGTLVDTVASERRIVVCRRSAALEVQFPKGHYGELVEFHERDQQIAAVLRGRGGLVEPWNTTNLIEALAKVREQS